MDKKFVILLSVCFISFLAGCSSAPKVTRVEREKPIDLSGRWNDYDAQLVSQEMIGDCLKRPWLDEFYKKDGRAPRVIVGSLTNRTSEHINVNVFTQFLERELLNAGKVNFVASSEEREQLRGERQDQQKGLTDAETMVKLGRELGADYMLVGSVNSVVDEIKGKYAILYQVNLELIDLENNLKVWIGQKEIKKFVEKAQYSL